MITLSSLGLVLSLLILENYGYAKVFASDSSSITGLHLGYIKTFSQTASVVYHLEEDEFISGNILYSEHSRLLTTDGKTTHLIVGSDNGYSEGRSAQARFDSFTGFLQTSSSQVLTADSFNHCMRYVNRLTNITSPFVGGCKAGGYADGQYTKAKFNYPYLVIRHWKYPETVIVTDYGNHALRTVELMTGNVRTLISSLPGNPLGAAFDPKKENLIIVFRTSNVSPICFLGKLDLNTLKVTLLTQAGRAGALDGEFSYASFGDSRHVIRLTDTVYVVTDHSSNKLRLVDFGKQRIESICAGSSVLDDGYTKNCSLNGPWGLLQKSGTLYIGENGAIRTISVSNQILCKNISLTLSDGEEDKCINTAQGNTICLPPGAHKYMVPKENCTIIIKITKEKECRYIADHILTGEHEKCIEIIAGHLMCFPLGIHTYRIPETNCTFVVNITKKDLFPCQNMAARLSTGEQEKCLEVTPGHIICLPAGSHTYRIPEQNCSFIINITEEVRRTTCTKEIYTAGDEKTMKADIMLPDGSEIRLPLGRHLYKKHFPNNTTCETVVHVTDPRMKMRLDVSADYQITCNLLNSFKDLTRSIAKARYRQIEQLSSGFCNESGVYDVMMKCESDVLQVTWPTDCFFDSKNFGGKGRIVTTTLENLQKVKGFSHLELFIPNNMPPVIQPMLNQQGLPATVLLTPVCLGGLKYVDTIESCQ